MINNLILQTVHLSEALVRGDTFAEVVISSVGAKLFIDNEWILIKLRRSDLKLGQITSSCTFAMYRFLV